MKLFYRKFLAVVVILGISLFSNAKHTMGGFVAYKYLGGTTYEIKLTLYRDCNTNTFFDGDSGSIISAAHLGIYEDTSNNLIFNRALSFPHVTKIFPAYDSSCSMSNTIYCIEQGIYLDTVVLPSATNGYTIVYQRCCLLTTTVNVFNSLEMGAGYTAFIPPTVYHHPNSPTFDSVLPVFFYVNQPISFRCSATDADGDSLKYFLCAPYIGGTASDPAPNTPTAPPYDHITWSSPFNLNNLLGGVPLTIDSVKGIMTAVPNSIGSFVVGVCVKSYSNGLLIDTLIRNLTFNIDHCTAPSAMANVTTSPSFHLSPNPASDEITISTEAQNGAALDAYVYDLTGNCVATQKNISDNLLNIKVISLPPGYYFVKVTDEHSNSAVKSFIVAR